MKYLNNKVRMVAMGAIAIIGLSGCAALNDTTMTIHDTDNISVSSTYAFDKDAYDSEREELNAIFDEYESNITEDVKSDLKIKDYDKDNLIGKTYEYKEKTLTEQLEFTLEDIFDSNSTLIESNGKLVGEFQLDSDVSEQAETVMLSIKAPGKILEAPGASIDGNTATWNLSEYSEDTIRFEADKGGNIMTFLGVIVGILVVAGIGLAVWWNRKGNAGMVTSAPGGNTSSEDAPGPGDYTAKDIDDSTGGSTEPR